MRVFGLWHGGHSYAVPDPERDLEVFDGIDYAMAAFRDRYDSNGLRWCVVQYADGRVEHVTFPAVDETATMDLYVPDGDGRVTEWPDWRLSFGPRGGVVRERM